MKLRSRAVYRAFWITLLSLAPCAQAQSTVLFEEDFESLTTSTSPPPAVRSAIFTTPSGLVSVNAGSTYNWYPAGPFGSQAGGGLGRAVVANNFGSGDGPADDWLMLPALNSAFFTGVTFDFVSEARFDDAGLSTLPETGPPTNGVGLDVLVSTDYNPALHPNPSSATWSLLPGYVLDTVYSGAFGNGVPSGTVDVSAIPGVTSGPATIAFRYRASSTTSARAWELDRLVLRGNPGLRFATTLAPFQAFSVASNRGWAVGGAGGRNAALADNAGADVPAEDWLISPRMVTRDATAAISFEYFQSGTDANQPEPLSVLVSTSYNPAVNPDPTSATWTNVTPAGLNAQPDNAWTPLTPVSLGVVSDKAYVAFRYRSSGVAPGSAKQVGVDNLRFLASVGGAAPVVTFTEARSGGRVSFDSTVTGGTAPFTYAWTFGDGTTATVEDPAKTYTTPGTYSVSLTVTDALGRTSTATKNNLFTFTELVVPSRTDGLRVATFNMALNSDDINGNAGDASAVANALATTTNARVRKVAEIIQRVNPDVILLNELDLAYNGQALDMAGTLTRVNNFRNNYLAIAQAAGLTGVTFPFEFIAATNTGVTSGYDLNNNGVADTSPGDQNYGDDAFGFGQFPGKYGFVILSKYPIDAARARTFQLFLWRDMPGALLPEGPNTTASYYSPDERNVFRLSSKSHADVPILFRGQTIHLLCSHPTPPTFDDGVATTHSQVTGTPANRVDRNGLRNHDEIRFWADYVDPARSAYIYDDTEIVVTGTDPVGNPLYAGSASRRGGLPSGARFVIVGDNNADPVDGDSSFGAALAYTQSSLINNSFTPASLGALEQVGAGQSNRETKTAAFASGVRVDYVLPSAAGFLPVTRSGVYWPRSSDLSFYLDDASDHHSVWVDLSLNSTSTPPPSLTYDQWYQSYGYFPVGSALAARGLDADGDGLTNFGEFVHGTDPNRAGGSVTKLEDGPAGKEFSYRRNRVAAVTWRIETATDLSLPAPWMEAVANVDYVPVSTTLDPADPNVETVRIRLLNTGSRRFVRTVATE